MQEDIGLQFWLTQWNWQPGIIVGTVIAIAGYFLLIGPLRRKWHLATDDEVDSAQSIKFVLGVIIIFLSLFTGLDMLGEKYLFSMHMVQHLLITLVGPPLIIAGIPKWMIDPLLRNRVLLWLGKFLTNPFFAFFLYNGVFWLWHAPQLYIAALFNPPLHVLEHMTFILTALLFWWPLCSQSKLLPPISFGKQMFYIFLGGMPTVLLGAGLTFSQPLYDPYIYAPRVWGLSPELDQQLGGLLMWVPGQLGFIALMSVYFIRWMGQLDHKQRAMDELLAQENETA